MEVLKSLMEGKSQREFRIIISEGEREMIIVALPLLLWPLPLFLAQPRPEARRLAAIHGCLMHERDCGSPSDQSVNCAEEGTTYFMATVACGSQPLKPSSFRGTFTHFHVEGHIERVSSSTQEMKKPKSRNNVPCLHHISPLAEERKNDTLSQGHRRHPYCSGERA